MTIKATATTATAFLSPVHSHRCSTHICDLENLRSLDPEKNPPLSPSPLITQALKTQGELP